MPARVCPSLGKAKAKSRFFSQNSRVVAKRVGMLKRTSPSWAKIKGASAGSGLGSRAPPSCENRDLGVHLRGGGSIGQAGPRATGWAGQGSRTPSAESWGSQCAALQGAGSSLPGGPSYLPPYQVSARDPE